MPPQLRKSDSEPHFSLKTTQAKFEQTTHECTICMEQKSGKDCHKLSYCGHVFCTECLQDFLNSCILEGNVDSVKCMDSECSDDRTLDPSELLQISLSEEQVRRYTTLQRKRKHDSDPTTVYCPRTWCQAPARTQVAEEHQQEMRHGTGHIPREQRLAICEDCDFAFCLHCERSWHGALVWCSKRSSEMSDEELASQEYMRAYSINCPTCVSSPSSDPFPDRASKTDFQISLEFRHPEGQGLQSHGVWDLQNTLLLSVWRGA